MPDCVLPNDDLAALYAAADGDGALCTLVGITGSFSRRLGAQVAVGWDGETVGSLSDGCLEKQLVSEARTARAAGAPVIVRFGADSPYLDFRLPCGSGLDILVDPAPDRLALDEVRQRIARRQIARLALALPNGTNAQLLCERVYRPPLRIVALGEGPELAALNRLAAAAGVAITTFDREGHGGPRLALGRAPEGIVLDAWSAVVMLFHDHEWERAILRWAIASDAFYVGAQGGERARALRVETLLGDGLSPDLVARVRSPIGLIPRARDPGVLALSVIAEVVAEYEKLDQFV